MWGDDPKHDHDIVQQWSAIIIFFATIIAIVAITAILTAIFGCGQQKSFTFDGRGTEVQPTGIIKDWQEGVKNAE